MFYLKIAFILRLQRYEKDRDYQIFKAKKECKKQIKKKYKNEIKER